MPDAMAARLPDPWRSAIEERRRACRDVPAGYVLMLVPDGDRVRGNGRTAPALDDLVIDPAPGLRARRRIAETCAAGGAGWTDYGAYAASRELLEALGEKIAVGHVAESALEFWEEPAGGEDAALQALHPGQGAYRRVFGRSNGQGEAVQVFAGADASLPRALAFAARGDAGEALTRMLPFLCPLFSRLAVVSSPDLFLDLMESEQPDAVFKLLSDAELAEKPALMRRDFEPWSGLRLPLPPSEPEAAPWLAIDFAASGNSAGFLGAGWSPPEPRHVWSLGAASSLTVAAPAADGAHELAIELSSCAPPPAPASQRLGVEVNGQLAASFRVSGPARLTAAVPAHVMRAARPLTIRFVHPDFAAPQADGPPRALCFARLELRRAPAASGASRAA